MSSVSPTPDQSSVLTVSEGSIDEDSDDDTELEFLDVGPPSGSDGPAAGPIDQRTSSAGHEVTTAVTAPPPAAAWQSATSPSHGSEAAAAPAPESPTSSWPTSRAPADTNSRDTVASPRTSGERVPRPISPDEMRVFHDTRTAEVNTERFDPKAQQEGLRDGRLVGADGRLNGSWTQIRHHVRRGRLPDGRTVRQFFVTLPFKLMDGLSPADLTQLQSRVQNALDTHVNVGYKLPDSGDQLHVTATFLERPDHGEKVTLTATTPAEGTDQDHWGVRDHDGVLVHEVLHYLGLSDEYSDAAKKAEDRHLFRRHDDASGVRTEGLMADALLTDLADLPKDYLSTIEKVSDTAVIPLHTAPETASAATTGPHNPSVVGRLPSNDGQDRQAPTSAAAGATPKWAKAPAAGPKLLKHPSHASGDMFSVAAFLVGDPDLTVFVTYDADPKSFAHATKIQKFYTDAGIEQRRVPLVASGDFKDLRNAFYQEQGVAKKDQKPLDLNQATYFVAREFTQELRNNIRDHWKVNWSEGEPGITAADDVWGSPEIEQWLASQNLTLEKDDKVAVLWTRFSGKNSEVHIEHDTSYFGISQIISQLGDFKAVLLVGDSGYPNKENVQGFRDAGSEDEPHRAKQDGNSKFDAIATFFNEGKGELPEDGLIEKVEGFSAQVLNLTEFWGKESVVRLRGNGRLAQFRLFEHLHRNSTARHLGFRSGNLEAMALMGYPVSYLEEPNSAVGGERMATWHDTGYTKPSRPANWLDPGYRRIISSQPPTRSGQYQKELPDEERTGAQKHAAWHKDSNSAKHLPNASRIKGFRSEDLSSITTFLRTGDPGQDLPPGLKEVMTGLDEKAFPHLDTLSKGNPNSALREVKNKFDKLFSSSQGYTHEQILRARNLYAQPIAHFLTPPEGLSERPSDDRLSSSNSFTGPSSASPVHQPQGQTPHAEGSTPEQPSPTSEQSSVAQLEADAIAAEQRHQQAQRELATATRTAQTLRAAHDLSQASASTSADASQSQGTSSQAHVKVPYTLLSAQEQLTSLGITESAWNQLIDSASDHAKTHDVSSLVRQLTDTLTAGTVQGRALQAGRLTTEMNVSYNKPHTNERTEQSLRHLSVLLMNCIEHLQSRLTEQSDQPSSASQQPVDEHETGNEADDELTLAPAEEDSSASSAPKKKQKREQEVQAAVLNNRLVFATNHNRSIELLMQFAQGGGDETGAPRNFKDILNLQTIEKISYENLADGTGSDHHRLYRSENARIKTNKRLAEPSQQNRTITALSSHLDQDMPFTRVDLKTASAGELKDLLTSPDKQGSVILLQNTEGDNPSLDRPIHAEQKILQLLHKADLHPSDVDGSVAIRGKKRPCFSCWTALHTFRTVPLSYNDHPGRFWKEPTDTIAKHLPHLFHEMYPANDGNGAPVLLDTITQKLADRMYATAHFTVIPPEGALRNDAGAPYTRRAAVPDSQGGMKFNVPGAMGGWETGSDSDVEAGDALTSAMAQIALTEPRRQERVPGGELSGEDEGVTVTLPPELTQDQQAAFTELMPDKDRTIRETRAEKRTEHARYAGVTIEHALRLIETGEASQAAVAKFLNISEAAVDRFRKRERETLGSYAPDASARDAKTELIEARDEFMQDVLPGLMKQKKRRTDGPEEALTLPGPKASKGPEIWTERLRDAFLRALNDKHTHSEISEWLQVPIKNISNWKKHYARTRDTP
ncbi:hypothetical protein [Streptomyces sp. YS-3]|uniref:hypothetical protein n=1 Tax=Streptomyces sp. YS-3 TaxID=3381352 RepID=UPI003862750D